MTIGPSYNYQRNFAQWLRNKDDDGDGEADRFIFGELDSRVLDISVRGDWTFTPTLSLQLYAQPFVTTGDYGAIKELARPRSYEFLPYPDFDGNPDFHFRSLHSNLVLRWEFRPGSTLYLVWQQSRAAASMPSTRGSAPGTTLAAPSSTRGRASSWSRATGGGGCNRSRHDLRGLAPWPPPSR